MVEKKVKHLLIQRFCSFINILCVVLYFYCFWLTYCNLNCFNQKNEDDDDDNEDDDEDVDDDDDEEEDEMGEDNLTSQHGNANGLMANKFGYIDDDGNVIYVDIHLYSDENDEVKLW